MTGVDYFAWVVFIVIILSVVAVFVVLAQMPGKTATERGHPQAEAINVASWLGLLFTGGIVWILAMVWSRMQPVARPIEIDHAEVDALKAKVAELESRLADSGEAAS
jgi:choline-glycine betaine transporter